MTLIFNKKLMLLNSCSASLKVSNRRKRALLSYLGCELQTIEFNLLQF